jgi:long-chain acyl-CoA synthetase
MPSRPWFKTYRELGVNPDVDVESHQSVTDLLDEAMRVYAERTAFRAAGQTLTYSEIDRLSAAFAAWLQTRLGVRKGDRVVVMTPNVPAFPIAFLGIIRAGAIQVNVNPFYAPRELEHQLKDSGSTIILVFDGVADTLAEIVDNTSIKTVIVAGATDGASRETIAAKGDGKLLGAFSGATSGPISGAMRDSLLWEAAKRVNPCLAHRRLGLPRIQEPTVITRRGGRT